MKCLISIDLGKRQGKESVGLWAGSKVSRTMRKMKMEGIWYSVQKVERK